MREINFVKNKVEQLGDIEAINFIENLIGNKPIDPDVKYYVDEYTNNFGGQFGFYTDKCIIGLHNLQTHMRLLQLQVILDAIQVVKSFGGSKMTISHAFSPECHEIKLKILEKLSIYSKIFSKKYIDDEDYVNSLPRGESYTPPERILCAANRYGDVILCGVRHGSKDMYSVVDKCIGVREFKLKVGVRCEQGFMTTKYRFVDRNEAWKIAVDQRQIVRRCGSDMMDGGTLYSENLY